VTSPTVLPPNTTISLANAEDVKALAAMRAAIAHDMTARFGDGAWSAVPGKVTVMKQMRASRVLVARRDAKVVGTVRLAAARPLAFDSAAFTPVNQALYVLGLAVAPQMRNQGLGRALMDAAKEAASSSGVDALWLDAYDHAAGAGPFYEKCGFRHVGRTTLNDQPLFYYEWLAGSAPV
jgi:ribosomal protein S18 acetylase RimI-like enzyme